MGIGYRERIRRYEVFIVYFSAAACTGYVLPLYLSILLFKCRGIERQGIEGIERHMLSSLALVVSV